MNKKIHILGGGTISHVASHLALAAPAYGTTARQLYQICQDEMPEMDSVLHLTRMAGGERREVNAITEKSGLETNEDISNLIENLVKDPTTKMIFFNVALVDFSGSVDNKPSDKYSHRLSSSSKQNMLLEPTNKVIDRIRKKRKDIFLIGFKTTCGATENEQYIAGLNLLKRASCNLVLSNDVKTRTNMIITPEEARYHITTNRVEALENLVEIAKLRSHLTFTRSTVVSGEPVSWQSPLVPTSLRKVVDHCIERGAYKPFRGATVGHFAAKVGEKTFLTSQRKTNFNDLHKLGLVKIKTDGPDSVIAYGSKPSVGGQSQRIIFHDHSEYDCVVHFHCPMREDTVDEVTVMSQREFECGSHECGENTSKGLKKFSRNGHEFSAVYLDQHGPNIVFNSGIDPNVIIEFIENNFDLSKKTGGYVS